MQEPPEITRAKADLEKRRNSELENGKILCSVAVSLGGKPRGI